MNRMVPSQTFRARTTQAALEEVQRVLGADAMILSVRQLNSGGGREVEVVATPAGIPEPTPVPPQPKTSPRRQDLKSSLAAGLGSLSDEELNTILTNLASRIHKQSAAPSSPPVENRRTSHPPAQHQAPFPTAAQPGREQTKAPAAPEVSLPLLEVQNRLASQGLDPELVKKLIVTCNETLNPAALQDDFKVRSNIRRQLEAHVRTAGLETLALEAKGGKVLSLIGMSGVGKTSACAKLAAYFTRKSGKKVAWICADTLRTGAIAQARSFTEPLGIPLYLAYTPEELAQAVLEAGGPEGRDADLILVDTPARNPHNKAEVVELGAFLTALPTRSTFLVAPATLQDADLRAAQAAFSPFNLKGIILTKLDEAAVYGSVINLAWRSQVPVIGLTTGARILEDLHPAQAAKMVGLLFGEKLSRA